MSLAVLEAAQSGMRIVTYSEVGTSEVFNGVSGVRPVLRIHTCGGTAGRS